MHPVCTLLRCFESITSSSWTSSTSTMSSRVVWDQGGKKKPNKLGISGRPRLNERSMSSQTNHQETTPAESGIFQTGFLWVLEGTVLAEFLGPLFLAKFAWEEGSEDITTLNTLQWSPSLLLCGTAEHLRCRRSALPPSRRRGPFTSPRLLRLSSRWQTGVEARSWDFNHFLCFLRSFSISGCQSLKRPGIWRALISETDSHHFFACQRCCNQPIPLQMLSRG